jgi:hypothetical protein
VYTVGHISIDANADTVQLIVGVTENVPRFKELVVGQI